MKIPNPLALILTDTHLKEDNIELVKDIWQQAIDRCKELKIGTIYFGGDFFTARKAQSLAVLQAANEILKSVRDNQINLTGIPGNHDKVDADSKDSYLDIFDEYFNLINGYYYDQVRKDICIHFIPYFKEDTSYLPYLDSALQNIKTIDEDYLLKVGKTDPKIKHILITHIAVSGVRNNDYSVVDNNLDKKAFSTFDKVLIGHYHDHSQVGDNIFYIGSAYQANYGEDAIKGFTLIMEDGSISFIKSNFKEFIKVKIDITDKEAVKDAEKKYKDSESNVRFVFEGEEAELKNVNKEKFSSLGIDISFKKDSAVPVDSTGLIEKANSISFDRSNVKNAFETFCQTKHIEDNSIGLEYLNQI